MKTWVSLVIPLVLFVLTVVVLFFYPPAMTWGDLALFQYLPYVVLAFCFLLGAFFAQTRIAFISMLLVEVLFLISRFFFTGMNAARGDTVVFLSAIYVPLMSALFFRLHEKGIFTVHAGIRGLIVLSTIVVMGLVPLIQSEAMSAFKPVSGILHIPMAGIVVTLLCVPVLFVRNKHESPALGPIICIAILFFIGALNFRSNIWLIEQGRIVFLLFMLGAGVTLMWAIIESAWRNANIDELTQLPGRRSLKHRMAQLGSNYAIAMVDIDYFKKINDKYGHDTGDQVLRFLAAQMRKSDIGKAYRYGGEEFVFICQNHDFKETVEKLDGFRAYIHSKQFGVRGRSRPRKKPDVKPVKSEGASANLNISVSIGVAEDNGRHSSPQAVLESADKALYSAKKAGRNCVKAGQ